MQEKSEREALLQREILATAVWGGAVYALYQPRKEGQRGFSSSKFTTTSKIYAQSTRILGTCSVINRARVNGTGTGTITEECRIVLSVQSGIEVKVSNSSAVSLTSSAVNSAAIPPISSATHPVYNTTLLQGPMSSGHLQPHTDNSDIHCQFSSGIETIAVISVEPHGVAQFRSINKIPEG
ncbi:hypothetical protein RHMOL_Rhmol12G0102400 [Rhododendron molle]|uniref:Uncharacterized protein n=1 Tax=Rhododendron molle TaxID=49168 RepID=A0ACC0LGC2_RHOML|nr:hypothetical protein RHMOL_Rhmol12G0102400 [Rhododendron molle]